MPSPALPTPREMEILKILWEIGPAGVRDVYRQLTAQGDSQDKDTAHNTVQSMLRIMEEKGLVKHRLEKRAFIYTPLFTREQSVNGFLHRVFDGVAEHMVAALLKSEKLSAPELQRLQDLIEAAQKKQTRK